jgi:two-component system cell cycle sensor histidine kinase/response regulator CckA
MTALDNRAAGPAPSGHAVAPLSSPGQTAHSHPLRIWTALIVLAGGVVATILFWQAVVEERRSFVEGATRHEAEVLASRLATEARAQAQGLYRMSQRWELRHTMPREEWESDTRLYVAHHSGYQAIAWIDPAAVVQWIVPQAGNEALWQTSLAGQPHLFEALETARQNGDRILSRPFQVVKDSKGFIACSPIFLPGGFGGWIAGFIRFDNLLSQIWYDELAQGYSVSLFYGGDEIYRRQNQRLTPGTTPQDVNVDLAGEDLAAVSLRLRVWPSPALAASHSSLPAVTLFVGLFVSCLLALSIYLAMTSRLRAREAEISREALRRSEERYRLLFNSNPHPMWVFDEKTLGFLAVNEAACRHYGYSREEFLGMTIQEIRPADDVSATPEQLAKEDETDQDAGISRHRTKTGSVIQVEITSHSLLFDGREAQVVLATDVTARHEMELQLRQAQKMEAIGQLAGGIAHDFNNILTAILGYSDLLTTAVGEKSPLMPSIEEIKKSGERAASLTRQLLAFSRRQVLEPKVLDVNALVSNLEKMLHRLIGEDVRLVTVLDPTVGRVRADAGQIEQVVMNLAINARDAMAKGGKLTIETSDVELDETYAREHVSVRAGRYVMLAVTDTGTGMSAETTSHIFEPFFTTKEQGKGTGLGLATVYGIVRQSGGYVWVYSELNRGTTFKVYLPRVDAYPEEHVAPSMKPSTGGTETILLVEDDQAVRALTRRLLQAKGYKVLEASGADEAMAIARGVENPIDLLLTDVVMPEMGGSDLASRISALRPEIIVLYMSGYTDDAVVRHGFIAERVHFLQKPFNPEALARKVTETLSSKRS